MYFIVHAAFVRIKLMMMMIVVTEVAAAGTLLIESGLPATVASSPSQPSQSAIRKQTGEIPAVTERPSAIEEDLWRPTTWSPGLPFMLWICLLA